MAMLRRFVASFTAQAAARPRIPHSLLTLAIASALSAATPAAAQSIAPGGLLEQATSTAVRPNTVPALPARGKFVFPAPYNTIGVRLTNSGDCAGQDCVNYVGYSYWRNTNNHVGRPTMLILITLDRQRGGGGPTLFSYDKATDSVQNLGPIFDSSSSFSWGSGEGWYWSPVRPTTLYIPSGGKLQRYDVETKQLETVFDVAAQFGTDRYIWQVHTSADDKVHSATLRSGSSDAMLGCVVYSETTRQFTYAAKVGDFDECQVDKSGRWLLIKENSDGRHGEDNVIYDLTTGRHVATFLDEHGAAGHSDNGHGYMLAEDNWNNLPGAIRLWNFGQPLPGSAPQGKLVYRTTDWSVDVGHISHANARADVPPDQQYACLSHAGRTNLPRANEVVCFSLDGSLRALVVAPVMTNLSASGGGSEYNKLPKGNLDVTGQYFVWTSNAGGSRLDAFVVRVPGHLLTGDTGGGKGGGGGGGGGTGGGGDTTPPAVAVTAPAPAATVGGSVTLQADASDDTGVVAVQFKLNGVAIGEVTSAPYALPWDTQLYADGLYMLVAVARDAAGNTATSAVVPVSVANSGSGGGGGGSGGGGGGADGTPPSVSLTAPAASATVSGVIDVSASASDAGGVVSVQFKLNGASLGEVVTAPYAMSWDTRTAANGLYILNAVARDAAGNTASSTVVPIFVLNTATGGGGDGGTATAPPAKPVFWVNRVNVTATGSALEKTGGCQGCADAGAVSVQRIWRWKGGSMVFRASETSSLRYVGLLNANQAPTTSGSALPFAIALRPGGIAEVRESGAYRTETPYTVGDVFRVAVANGVISYYKNGARFHQSAVAPVFPLRLGAAMLTLGATVKEVTVQHGQ